MHTAKHIVSARGYTSVVMVVNLNRFVKSEDKDLFHALRGQEDFRRAIQEQWTPSLRKSPWFQLTEGSFNGEHDEGMNRAEAGFATGIFRQYLLETAIETTFRFNKKAYESEFPSALKTNFQFKNIFLPVWKRWDIFVRPSTFGMLVIRMTKKYEQSTTLEQIASDVVKLQSPFDIASAHRWLKGLEKDLADDKVKLEEKRKSVQELLKWIQGTPKEPEVLPPYAPVQWQLAMEISKAFIKSVGEVLHVNGESIHLYQPPPALSHPLHDSYVIYHLDSLYASPYVLPSYRKQKKGRKQVEKWRQKPRFTVPVSIEDLYGSIVVRQKLRNLLEGSLLRLQDSHADAAESATGSARFFPRIRADLLDSLQEQNLASWHDELCVMNSRVALIKPSEMAKDCDLFVSTLPADIRTSHVRYPQYWQAIELMIEFVAEVRVLAQLVEHSSTRLLQNCVGILHKKRRGVFIHKSAEMLQEFNQVISQTANLSRLLAIAQTLNNPSTWSRADFALSKAQHLLKECQVPASLQHAADNVTNLNALVEHLDELFLTDDDRQRERNNLRLSLAITALSLVLTLLMLPSFWADLHALNAELNPEIGMGVYLAQINKIGTGVAIFLIAFALLWLAGLAVSETLNRLRRRRERKP